ncbi:unnamed protein product [Enterobius vermicularis]|uniref:Activin_recp domain-containing protein n=1 Tax=Enterobius vermicularis TaxID=51028 RepID=A0A0N4VNJ3_ENTVE|nr:unnamed protein product [Enterobius vermicularis]
MNLSDVKMGCRQNKAGATMCLCRDFHECNDIAWREKLEQMVAINLPNLECYRSDETDENRLEKCEANYCFYEESMDEGDDGNSTVTKFSSCGEPSEYLFDIDLFPSWATPAMFPGECSIVETEAGHPLLRCMCNEDGCNDKPLYSVTRGNVKCVVYDSSLESAEGECTGHFCFIQQTYPPFFEHRVAKGCLSVSESNHNFKFEKGYQNIMGLEQWLCEEDFCNVDVDSARRSAGVSAAIDNRLTTGQRLQLAVLLFCCIVRIF